MSNSRAARATRRRADALPGHIIRLGDRKPDLYAEMSIEARLEAYWRLIQRAWKASGRELPLAGPRCELPGEVFLIADDG